MDLIDALRAAHAQSESREDEDGRYKVPYTADQERIRLQEWFAQIHDEKERFEPGDIVRHKTPGMTASRTSRMQGVFVRYLSEEIDVAKTMAEHGARDIEHWTHCTAADVFDCVVAFIFKGRADAENVVAYLCDSRIFTKVK